MRKALQRTGVLILLTLLFAGVVAVWWGFEDALQFLTGYVIELSLSMDNVFAIALIFDYFAVPGPFRARALQWGVAGAIVMRAVIIVVGTALVEKFHWTLYLMGAFLLFTGVKWALAKGPLVRPRDNLVVRAARRWFPVTPGFEDGRFFGRVGGRRALTPLFLAVLLVETSDILFAMDSIPAVFAVTQDPFIVLTSNIAAILGLRSLYFVLVGAMDRFRHLKRGLACVLIFIGGKMLAAHWWKLPTGWSLAGVALILGASMAMSRPKPAPSKP